MESSIKDLSKYRFSTSLDDLETAEILLENGKYKSSVNYRLREKADYKDFYAVSKDQAEEQLKKAKRVIEIVKPYLGDERNFVRIRKLKNGRELEEVNDVELEVNSKYKVSVYYHNDAREELNDDGSGISRNTSLRIVCPSHINVGEVGVITGYINASNTTPNEIWASVYLKTCSNTNIRFVSNTAYIHNSGTTDGIQLSGDALMSSGIFLGHYDNMWGMIPAGLSYGGYVSFEIETY